MERRRAPRRVPASGEPISRVRLRTGFEMGVLDVSSWGVLVEGSARLLPGTHVDVHVVTPAGRVLVRSRVARCFVAAIGADVVRYRGALAFERRVDTSGYSVPVDAHQDPGRAGAGYPTAGVVAASVDDERLSA